MQSETLETYIQQELSKSFKGSINTELTQEQVKDFIVNNFPVTNPNFKFTIQKNPLDSGKLDIIPHNLYTGVFLKEGLQINPSLTEASTLYGKYKFIGGELIFEPDKIIERVEIKVVVKKDV